MRNQTEDKKKKIHIFLQNFIHPLIDRLIIKFRLDDTIFFFSFFFFFGKLWEKAGLKYVETILRREEKVKGEKELKRVEGAIVGVC